MMRLEIFVSESRLSEALGESRMPIPPTVDPWVFFQADADTSLFLPRFVCWN